MNHLSFLLSAVLAVVVTPAARAGAAGEAATIRPLSGWVMAVQPDGRPKSLALDSVVRKGDTLVSQPGSFVGLALDNGNEAIVGPGTTVKLLQHSRAGTVLKLSGGALRVHAPAGRFTIEAGNATIEAAGATFIVSDRPGTGAAFAAHQRYMRTALALSSPVVVSDAGGDLDLRELVAQAARAPAPSGSLAPGLYVQVIDGLIRLSNQGGSQSFAAGQFGFTPSTSQPPIVVPSNPGLQFTPPPVFSPGTGTGTGTGARAGRDTVDCEVR